MAKPKVSVRYLKINRSHKCVEDGSLTSFISSQSIKKNFFTSFLLKIWWVEISWFHLIQQKVKHDTKRQDDIRQMALHLLSHTFGEKLASWPSRKQSRSVSQGMTAPFTAVSTIYLSYLCFYRVIGVLLFCVQKLNGQLNLALALNEHKLQIRNLNVNKRPSPKL